MSNKTKTDGHHDSIVSHEITHPRWDEHYHYVHKIRRRMSDRTAV